VDYTLNKYRKYAWPYATMDGEEQKRPVIHVARKDAPYLHDSGKKSGFSLIPIFQSAE
jgi:hypothetical protein